MAFNLWHFLGFLLCLLPNDSFILAVPSHGGLLLWWGAWLVGWIDGIAWRIAFIINEIEGYVKDYSTLFCKNSEKHVINCKIFPPVKNSVKSFYKGKDCRGRACPCPNRACAIKPWLTEHALSPIGDSGRDKPCPYFCFYHRIFYI